MTVTLRLQLAHYRCRQGHRFKEPASPDLYGTLLLRSRVPGGRAVVEALTDPVFDEVDDILRSFDEYDNLPESSRPGVMQRLFSVACDPDPEGGAYVVDAPPCCPRCGSCDVRYLQHTDPGEYVEVELPHVTHTAWRGWSDQERRRRLRESLADLLSAGLPES